MDVSFASKRLKRICESDKDLQRAYGKGCAKKLMGRLSDLRAAHSLEDLRQLPGHCHELDGERKGQLAIEIAGGWRLVLTPTGGWPGRKSGGSHVWDSVEAVTVIEIVDYH